MHTTVLVTGGAGYIGSHVLVSLVEAGYQPVVIDDLSNGSPIAIERVEALTRATKPLRYYESNVRGRLAVAMRQSDGLGRDGKHVCRAQDASREAAVVGDAK